MVYSTAEKEREKYLPTADKSDIEVQFNIDFLHRRHLKIIPLPSIFNTVSTWSIKQQKTTKLENAMFTVFTLTTSPKKYNKIIKMNIIFIL